MTALFCARALTVAVLIVVWLLEPDVDEVTRAHRATLNADARAIMDALNEELRG